MRNRSSKQSSRGGTMDGHHQIDGHGLNKKLKEEEEEQPHLSGAYIRSLVKQLTSSRTKSPIINPKSTHVIDGEDHHDGYPQNLSKFSDQTHQSQSPQQLQPKKQVRRRLHTSRPYQERLLNMAEARREIVTALKFHRAAMKQANEQQQQQQSQSLAPPPSSLDQKQEPETMNTNNTFSDYLDINLSSYSSVSNCAPLVPNCSTTFGTNWIAPLPIYENLNNFPLPNQPLGLNLNFQDFNNLDATTLYHINTHPSSIHSSYPTPSSSSSPTLSSIEDQLSHYHHPEGHETLMAACADNGGVVNDHAVMDDEEMAEMRSIGEQHQMEWNDTLSFVTSAWWFKFMKTMEIDPENNQRGEDDGFQVFDEIMEFPAWMNNANEQHLDDCFSEEYLQEPALPSMDIGEIEGIDGEWLA